MSGQHPGKAAAENLEANGRSLIANLANVYKVRAAGMEVPS